MEVMKTGSIHITQIGSRNFTNVIDKGSFCMFNSCLTFGLVPWFFTGPQSESPNLFPSSPSGQWFCILGSYKASFMRENFKELKILLNFNDKKKKKGFVGMFKCLGGR